MPDSSTGGFGVSPQDVSEAASLMSGLTSSGTEVSKALGVLDPLVFGIIGSSTAAANGQMENAVLQTLQGVLNLFSNTSSDIGAAASIYSGADSTTASAYNSLTDDTATSIPGMSAGIPDIADDMPGMAVIEDSLPGGGFALSGLGAAGFAADNIALGALGADDTAGLESSVLARLAGEEEMLGEFGEEAESAFMSLFRSLRGPSEVNERWNGLSEDEQEEAIGGNRGAFAGLDGIPNDVRNLVNTGDLDDVIAETELQIKNLREAAVQADRDHDDDEEKAVRCLQQAAVLLMQLGGLRALKGQLQANPSAYLLALGTDPDGTGRYILAINNPDTADNVATLVPESGFGLTEGISGFIAAAVNLAALAAGTDRTQTTSVVIWANYSAPLSAGARTSPPETQAAPVLAQFQSGLYSTNARGSVLHATVIGIDTGSVLVREAARPPGSLGADDIIALGGPGLDATTASGPGSSTDSPATEGRARLWLYADESGSRSLLGKVDYFDTTSRIMPDMAHIIVGNYDNIYYLQKQ